MFTRQGHTICASITILTMPFPPISAFATYFTVPCTAVLNNFIPTERIPIPLTALRTAIIIYKLTELNLLAPT
jgi:hypothetical protein